MNILLSDQWLKDNVKTSRKPQEIAKDLTLHSMSVERVMPEVELLTDLIVLGEILEVKTHPNADKLQLAVVSTGKEKFNVVCGAKNITAGMKIAFAKPGSMVRWHGEGEPVELQPAKIRGEMSYGMICDDAEIGLAKYANENHEITDYSHLKSKVGTPMSKALGLDDTVYDIEITVNRVDAGSVVGMARELSAISGEKLLYKEDADLKSLKPSGEKLPLDVDVKDTEKCFGFHAIVLDDVKVGPSPDWLKRRLRAAGHSSINNVVDITNYVMRELGHPLHAFDYNAIKDGKLIVRAAKKNEKIKTLDEVDEKLDDYMVVIADKDQAHSLAGVMGGYDSMITEKTKTVLLEAATWNRHTIRKTMMSLDKFSDAGGYFSKGLSPQLSAIALKRAVQLIKEVTGARIASAVVSKASKAYKPKKLSMSLSRAELYIGAKLKPSAIKQQLTALGFTNIKIKGDELNCFAPHWRQFDMEIEEDLIEEVARLYGYHNIENKLPSGELPFPEIQKHLEFEEKIKVAMKGAGFTETFTYSMVSEKLRDLAGKGSEKAIKLMNPLDEDHVYMRTSLIPSILEVAAMNQGVADEINLFEIAKIYIPNGKKLPSEESNFVAVLIGQDLENIFRKAKGIALHVLSVLGLNDLNLARINVVDAKQARAVGLKKDAVIVEIDLHGLIDQAKSNLHYKEQPKFPAVSFDLSVEVNNQISWESVRELVRSEAGKLLESIELFDIYKKDDRKSFAFHLNFRDEAKTLESKDIEPIREKIISVLEKELNASLRS